MTFRERLADWISGGAVSFWQQAAIDADRQFDSVHQDYMLEYQSHTVTADQRDWFAIALSRIAACETPNANATVRRMARIAREALK